MIKSLNNYFNVKNITKFIIFFNLIIIVIYPNNLKTHPFYLPNKKPILKYDETKIPILKKGRDYLDDCLNFPNKQIYTYINKPKVSVIIPMFNCEKTIKSTLRSVQYQNLSKIEIILINDFSSDSTSKIIKKIIKRDKRIKLINNKKNMGTLYSRCIGVLMAKGEYIFGLDNDDLYFDSDVLDYIYKKGKNDNLDIIGFLTIDTWNYSIDISQMVDIYSYQFQDEFYLEQPELSTWMIKFNNDFL